MAKTLSIGVLTDVTSLSTSVAAEFYLYDGSDEVFRKIAPLNTLQIIYYHQEEQITVNSGGVHLFSYDSTNVVSETGATDVEGLFNLIKSALYG